MGNKSRTLTQGLNTRAAAKYVGLSIPTFRKFMDQIPHRRAGKRRIFSKDALNDWMKVEGA